jgi:hypothetical protein
MKNAKLKLLLILCVSTALALLLSHNKAPRRVTIEWTPTPGAVAYRVIYGTAGKPEVNTVVGYRAVLLLPRGRTNYVRVIAILPNGEESLPSTNLVISP